MIGLIIAPFFVALLILFLLRIYRHISIYAFPGINLIKIFIAIIIFGGLFAVVIGFLMPNGSGFKRIFTQIGFYWFGVILYLFVSLAIALLCRYIIWLLTRNRGYNVVIARNFTIFFVLIFTTIMSVYGIENAHDLRITNYEINSNKEANIDSLNIVLIADLHLGYNAGVEEMKDMVDKINSLNPDVVLLAGDIFDNEYEALDDPKELVNILKSIKSKYGNYATYGNHDIEEKIFTFFTFEWSKEAKARVQADERMNSFVRDAGFKLLYDSYIEIEDSVYIYGRPDAGKINFGNMERKGPDEITKDMDINKTIICVDHEPSELEELSNNNVDIDLCGHTHNGQIWPGTITINLFWDNAYGLKYINNMASIVTSGVGLYGVNMRTGCYPEVVNIKLNLKKIK